MSWSTISARQALSGLKHGARALDVRSPKEFRHGAIPHFQNIPILNDEHRHLVGLTYKQKGQAAAIDLGMSLVAPLRATMIESWRAYFCEVREADRILICWRGGLRSKTAAEWLSESGVNGVRVEGGYKAIRRELMQTFSELPDFVLLGGFTGGGKTKLLSELKGPGVLDLEGLAHHRGSSFGYRMEGAQPSQQTFENRVGFELFQSTRELVLEAESRMIGQCCLPVALKEKMDQSPMVILETSMSERVAHIYREYVEEPCRLHDRQAVFQHLEASLVRIQKRLGGLRFQAIQQQLRSAFESAQNSPDVHAPWIESLLREYYDPLYEHSLQRDERQIVFRGRYGEVKDYLQNRLGRRRS